MNAVFDALSLQAAMLDVVAASHATPRLIGERQQQRLVRLLEAAQDLGAGWWTTAPHWTSP